MRERRPEDREDRVADELVDGAAVGHHDVGHAREIPIEDVHDVGGIAVLGEPRVAAQIGHEDRHHPLLSSEAEPFRRLQQRLDDFGGHVAAERVANEVALAEPLDHPVERARELADLVGRPHGQRLRQIAAGDPGHPARQRADGPRDAPGEEQAEHEGAQAAGQCPLENGHRQLAGPVEEDLDGLF